MKKKIFLQLILFSIIIVIFVVFYKKYFEEKELVNNILESEQSKDITIIQGKSSLIHNIKYTSQKKNGQNYIISSEFGELNVEQPELILMNKVQAIINLENSSSIVISSDNALYNNINYNTNFYDNVLITYTDHIVKSNNFDLFFEKNVGLISNNVIYKNLNTTLEADKIEIDLITKNSKIFMNKKSNKVKITNIN
ncbi:hypothetical protein N9586_00690 [Candidatus Pelagibacter sp.]|nr:hypothetical protein [Candidatus Pelagibacter sp.]